MTEVILQKKLRLGFSEAEFLLVYISSLNSSSILTFKTLAMI